MAQDRKPDEFKGKKQKSLAVPIGSIPRIGHVIWLGRQHLNAVGIKKINKFLRNRSFEAWVWVDTTVTHEKLEQIQELYSKKLDPDKRDRLRVFDLEELLEDYPIEVRVHYRTVIRYLIDRFRPNYGEASDLIRYLLKVYGGFYRDAIDVGAADEEHFEEELQEMQQDAEAKRIDQDELVRYQKAAAHKKTLNLVSFETFFKIFDDPVHRKLYVDGLTQKSNLSLLADWKEQFAHTADLHSYIQEALKYAYVGNDAFICPKQDPLMGKVCERAFQNYDIFHLAKFCQIPKDYKSAELAYDARNIKDHTINMTGPHLFRAVLREDKQQNIGLLRQCGSHCLISPDHYNSIDWLKIPAVMDLTQKQAIELAVRHMQFEFEHFHIFRLEDFISDMIQSTALLEPFAVKEMKSEQTGPIQVKDKYQKEKAQDGTVLDELKKVPEFTVLVQKIKDSKEDIVVQCAFRYEPVIKFYQQEELMIKPRSSPRHHAPFRRDRTGLQDPILLPAIIGFATSCITIKPLDSDLGHRLEYAEKMEKEKKWDGKGDLTDLIFFPASWGPERLLTIFPLILDGLDFIEGYLRHASWLNADKIKIMDIVPSLPKETIYEVLAKPVIIYYNFMDKAYYCLDRSPVVRQQFKDKLQEDPLQFLKHIEKRILDILNHDKLKKIPEVIALLKQTQPQAGPCCRIM